MDDVLKYLDEKIDKRLDKVEEKIDVLTDTLQSIDKTLAVQAAQLTEHIRRTELLEKHQDKQDARMDVVEEGIDKQKTIDEHTAEVWDKRKRVLKIVLTIVGVIASVLGLWFH